MPASSAEGSVAPRMSIPPAVAGAVARAGLEDLLDRAAAHRLVLVSAGPGWGKTTAVSAWARRQQARGERVAWLTVDAIDDDPAAFWHALLPAIVASGAVPEGHPLRAASAAAGISPEVLVSLYRGLAVLPEALVIVLDDFHVIGDPGVIGSLTGLLAREMPVRLVVVTRFDSPLPLHQLRLRGELAEITATDLVFDSTDVHRLAAAMEAPALTEELVDGVLERTQGWPAGVRLAVLHLSRPDADTQLEAFVGTTRSVAEYLRAEVLDRQSDQTLRFMLRTSVADPLSGALAEAIVPSGGGYATLEMLADSQQFVAPVDPARTWFRFHPLLRDLLVHVLRRDDPAGFVEANRAAARWFLDHDDPIEALRHAIAAEDWDLATETYVAASPAVIGARRGTLSALLRTIPYDRLAPSPSLELCACGLAFISGHIEAVGSHVRRARQLLAEGAPPLAPMAEAMLCNFEGAAARGRGDAPAVIASASAALGLLEASTTRPGADGARTIATSQRGIGRLWDGEPARARPDLVSVATTGHHTDVALLVVNARSQLSWCDLVQAQVDQALRTASDVAEFARARGWTSLLQVRVAFTTLAAVHGLRGDAGAAQRNAAAAIAAIGGGQEFWPTIALHLTQAQVDLLRSAPRSAAAQVEEAVSKIGGLPLPAPVPDMIARLEADLALQRPSRQPTRLPGVRDAQSATSLSSQARLSLAAGDLDQARALALAVPVRPEHDSLVDLLAAIEAHLVLALVEHALGHEHASLVSLRDSIDLARPMRIVRPFLYTEPPRTERLLELVAATQESPDDFADAVRTALASRARRGTEPTRLAEPLTSRELDVLVELATMRSNLEIAEHFFISINTVKTHLAKLYGKLGVTSRREAVSRGRELGLL